MELDWGVTVRGWCLWQMFGVCGRAREWDICSGGTPSPLGKPPNWAAMGHLNEAEHEKSSKESWPSMG